MSPLPLLQNQKKRTTWNHMFRSDPRGVAQWRTCEDFKCIKSSISIAGLCFTFSFPLPFSISLLNGRTFKYLSMACRKQKSADLLFQQQSDLPLASVNSSQNYIQLAGRYLFQLCLYFFILTPSLTIRKSELEVIPFNVGTFDKLMREHLEIVSQRNLSHLHFALRMVLP